MKKSVAAIALLGMAAILTGCGNYRPAPNAFHEAISQPYILDAGDRVRITVFEQESLTNVYAVDQAGYISFPLIGAVPARGYTLEQIGSLHGGQTERRLPAQSRHHRRDRTLPSRLHHGRRSARRAIHLRAGHDGAEGNRCSRRVHAPAPTRAVPTSPARSTGDIMTGRVPISDPVLPGDTVFVRERLF